MIDERGPIALHWTATCKNLRLERQGRFPKRTKIGDRLVGWDLGEVVAWIEARNAIPDRL
jgi:predicted DNA-binding transcriptional regulator AlpA